MKYASLREKISAETQERRERYAKFAELWEEACKQGDGAASNHIPQTMIVSSDTTQWVVPEGACGFAEIRLPKGNTSFAHWAKKNAGFSKHCYGGLYYWVSGYGQSMERKEAFARKACEVLQAGGIDCFATSRMD
jgi:hypothetical protein